MTEEQLNQIRDKARSGDAHAEYELACLYEGDYYLQRSVYTLRAIYQGVLKIYHRALTECGEEVGSALSDKIVDFKKSPTTDKLSLLLSETIQYISRYSPIQLGTFSSTLVSGIKILSEATEQILNRHYPEWKSKNGINTTHSNLLTEPTIDHLSEFIISIGKTANDHGDQKTINQLLADALCKGDNNALSLLAKKFHYNTYGIQLVNGIITPVYSGNTNVHFPAISIGEISTVINATQGRKISVYRMFDFFSDDMDLFNHYFVFEYDINDSSQRKNTSSFQQSTLGSVLAWIGPNRFSIDIIDWEHTGIGAHLSNYFSQKFVKFITRKDEWDAELESLETIIENRAAMMDSIIAYNLANPDNIQPWKIILLQDYFGELYQCPPLTDEHCDQAIKEEHSKNEKNARRFAHILERGYKYGIIFIISSSYGKYNGEFRTQCRNICRESDPYNTFRINEIDSSDADWFMRWISANDAHEQQNRVISVTEPQDGSDGVLTTVLTDDGSDIEFRFDTISHTHAFVIGQTGSGKSVLLHNIITGLVNNYSPEDLMLYLIDMKMGGVEFNRYKRLPHIRSLLVDNSDIQIVLEIVRDIELMMRDRGKKFRAKGVSNIREYNHTNPDSMMSQVIVIIDECHVIFSMSSGRDSSKYQREITERLAKITKEGRSQGIHLILSTQTLSGSEIPPEIQKNITDYYLLKCAPSDSEQLVRNSSSKTASLSVGNVFYHHSDKQTLFQGKYNDTKTMATLIFSAIRRYSGNKNNGQFYFNGSQIFELTADIINIIGRNDKTGIHGTPGCLINLQQTAVDINLRADYSENCILTGINSEEQLSRTTLALLISQIAIARQKGENLNVCVIDCLDKESETSRILCNMADSHLISLSKPEESESMLVRLCDEITEKNTTPTLLYIFGQERFGELKRNQKFEQSEEVQKSETETGIFNLFEEIRFDPPTKTNASYDSFQKALTFILENGPRTSHHVIIEVDKADKLLFDEYISPKTVSSRFKHLIVLRTDVRCSNSLGISDEYNVETLSTDPERLRAYYYNDDSGNCMLFSPFDFLTPEKLSNLI